MTRRSRRVIETTVGELESSAGATSSFRKLWVASAKAEDGQSLTPDEERLLSAPEKYLTEQAKAGLAALGACQDGDLQ